MKSSMEDHLRTENHYSASEYLLEAKPIDLNEPEAVSPHESPSHSSISNSSPSKTAAAAAADFYSDRKLGYLKKRSSLINLRASDELAVFCPKSDCRLFMSTNILAGVLHFKYAHSADSNIEIFSLGKLKSVREVRSTFLTPFVVNLKDLLILLSILIVLRSKSKRNTRVLSVNNTTNSWYRSLIISSAANTFPTQPTTTK